MKIALQRLGNSKAVVIPKAILDKCGFDREVEMRVEDKRVILSPARPVREGWEEAFRKAAQRPSDEALLPEHLSEEWDREEWTW